MTKFFCVFLSFFTFFILFNPKIPMSLLTAPRVSAASSQSSLLLTPCSL